MLAEKCGMVYISIGLQSLIHLAHKIEVISYQSKSPYFSEV